MTKKSTFLIGQNQKQMTKEFSESKNISFPLLTIKALAVRQFGFFVWNILVIMVKLFI
jgi:hypothetical protein